MVNQKINRESKIGFSKYMDRFAMMEQVIKEGVKPKEIDSSIREKEIEMNY